MNGHRTLVVEFLDTWHVGSGRGRGSHLDAAVERDVDGLPYLPGRLLRGVIRDAAEALCAWGHLQSQQVADLFGTLLPAEGASGLAHARPGRLQVSDARLPPDERAWLGSADEEAQAARSALFLESFQTAIDERYGTARSRTLRGTELVVPLTLHAELGVQGTADDIAQGWALLERSLPLVRALGAHKTRGHGRVQLRWGGQA
ncbi:RAMP superfamily CRISPR-associated protein [Caldimonas tepidiphila]|uniref:RAMP superfamily CRISPR-associated protein n=1 Tax=Caldimonas tepidiphila TaxID=2315841 RepID=UPI000E5B50E7|nr:RAMP superfamily CRISPR-associated protein [Caldimonas tepidiphila]